MSTPAAPESTTGAAPLGGRMKWLLIASLGLNLLIAGAVAGAFVLHRGGHHPGRWGVGPQDFGLMGFAKTLPAERRQMIREELKGLRGAMKPMREDIRRARQDAAATLGAEPFNRDALKGALEKVGTSELAMRATSVDRLLGVIDRMTAEERRGLADGWKRRIDSGPKRDRDKSGDKDN